MAIFGERVFSYPMKNFATETIIFQNTNAFKEVWKKFQLHFFAYLSSSNAFIASQYLTVRGMRTLNGTNSQMLARITGESVRSQANSATAVFDLVKNIRKRRLRWLGKILRGGICPP